MRALLAAVSLLGCAAVAACAPLPASPPQGAVSTGTLRVGSVEMHRCLGGDYYCGSVRVALDPAGRIRGSLDIAVAWLPHKNRSARSSGTILAVEGGPGYPSIESRASYRGLYAPLLDTRDLLLVDNRGTGLSGAIDCRPLQGAKLMRLRDVTACGDHLGDRSDLYGTALAADDLARVLSAMNVAKVDAYGDSYGTFFVQAFAGRHPEHVRSIVLDGAYQVIGGSPWYPSEGPTMRDAFNAACARSPVCAGLGGTSLDRIRALLVRLRDVRDPHITPSGVAFIMDAAGLDTLAYRDLDAASRAYLAGDGVPLQRLVEETYANEEGAGGGARGYSQGLFVAASCSDNPQAYDMRLQPPQREIDWQRSLARKREEDPHVYAPLTLDEFLGIPLDYAYVPLCRTWPVASAAHPAGQPVPPGTRFPDVPTLVLNGDLDTTTTPAEGAGAARLFPRARHVIVANTGHVTALGDYGGCAAAIVRRFTLSGTVDAGCAQRVPALHLVPAFSRTLDEVSPATAQPGNAATERELREAAAAILAAADVLSRAYEFYQHAGSGLRGGSFSATTSGAVVSATLAGIRWTNDLAVSGDAQLDARTSGARAHLTLAGAAGSIDASWQTTGSDAAATISGTLGGHALRATMPAP